jgi:general secretion pathway protein D
LLQELDKPVKSALIEVTVAEVSLDDKQSLGIEWSLSQVTGAGGSVAAKLAGLISGTDGLTVTRFGSAGETKAVLNALATSSRANILSSPRVVARNGETATITVGQEVPLITSQQNNANTNPSTGGILQTIQYRNTGVILKVRPIVHAGGRIDLEVSQEVSDAKETTTGVNSSPTILNRKVETKLSLKDGASVMLAGLMSQAKSVGDKGIPYLKDIPVAGQLFRSNSDTNKKTELLVMITPYVINDDYDAQAVTEAFRAKLGAWARAPLPARPDIGTTQPPSAVPTDSLAPHQAEPPPNAAAPTQGAAPPDVEPQNMSVFTPQQTNDTELMQMFRKKQEEQRHKEK